MGWLVAIVVFAAGIVLGYARARSLKTFLVTVCIVGLLGSGFGACVALFPKDTTEAKLMLFGEPDAVLLVHELWRPAKGAPRQTWYALDPATGALLGELRTSGFFNDVEGELSPFDAHLLGEDDEGRPLLVDARSLEIAVPPEEMAQRIAARWPGMRRLLRLGNKLEVTLASGSRTSVRSLDGKESSWRVGMGEASAAGHQLPAADGREELLVMARGVAEHADTHYFSLLVRKPGGPLELVWRRTFTELGLDEGGIDDILPAGDQVLVTCSGRPPGTSGWHEYFRNTFRFVMSLDRRDGTVRWATRL
jgi:hypothetical protein